ncbi:Protein BFR2 [Colletotrichum orbiculare MAFF 240422]|uniref:Protein BFR2 n=1 Tax=Colletotrichum orbiculare (strain 104-T / ATCC 96160 / CBS 514.97 / LARS 414 / MAFF 240422) TaxID=1213857 RepID=A0A484G6T1_COLOR|nr:Protein BFR2 [Colletotrichum orbiculare MAFF 240422]
MTVVHNYLLRGLNAIYLQAPHIKTKDEFSFANYMFQWYRSLDAHHRGEEKHFFPAVDRLTDTTGYMDVNIEQHRAFHDGLEEFGDYIKSLVAKREKYNGHKVVSLIDNFGKSLHQHLEEEIPTILGLEKFGFEKIQPIEKVLIQEGQEVMGELGFFTGLPWFLTTMDGAFEGGIWANHPDDAVAQVLLSFCRHVAWWVHYDWWKFGACDGSGNLQPFKMTSRRRASDWEEQAPKDLDPEAEPVEENDDESDSEESVDENAGTEHYVSVGKSKLRGKDGVSLGPQYRGTRVSRNALNDDSNDDSDVFEDAKEKFDSNDEEFDDPETADLAADEAAAGDEDFEIASDNALGDSDDEKLDNFVFRGSSQPKDKKGGRSKRPTAADFISDEEEEDDDSEVDDDDEEDIDINEDSDEGGDDDDDDEEGSEGSDEDVMDGLEGSEEDEEEGSEDGFDDDESDEDSDDSDAKPRRNKGDARAEQRKLMNEGQKTLAATMTAAAQKDAEKGVAVREQRKTFDGLLNIRIRLQKALVATNSFAVVEAADDEEQNSEPYEAAEEAALKLLNTLDSFRASLLPAGLAQAGGKRKRGDFDASTPSGNIWEGIQEAEQRALKYRKTVLETWSAKTRSATVEVKSRKLINTQHSVVASIEEQLLNADRLVKRTRTPRSCAPAQVAQKVNEDADIYDDADFYQLLLKELVEQRTNVNGSTGAAAQPTVRWAAMKEAKTKKHVDRRASKGRKMRFNVHEKLQNLMAPEDRRSWEQDAVDRLFGTLFGQKLELGEQVSDDDMEDEVNAEEEGLRLFRS